MSIICNTTFLLIQQSFYHCTKLGPKASLIRVAVIKLCSIESMAFSVSAVIIYPGMLCISVNSNISEMSRIDSPMYLPGT